MSFRNVDIEIFEEKNNPLKFKYFSLYLLYLQGQKEYLSLWFPIILITCLYIKLDSTSINKVHRDHSSSAL